MFVIAARDMKAGEEITLPYICAIHPVREREEALSEWGIDNCNCSRCKFESDVSDSMNVYGANIDKTSSALSQEIVPRSVPSMEKFYQSFKSVVKPMEREWLLASHQHSLLYASDTKLYKSIGKIESYYKEASVDYHYDDIWGRLKVLQAAQATVPGHPYIVQMLVREAELIYATNDELGSLGLIDSALNMARNAFFTVFGNLENVDEALREISKCNRDRSVLAMEIYGIEAAQQNSDPHQPDFPSHKDVQVDSSSNHAGKGLGKGPHFSCA